MKCKEISFRGFYNHFSVIELMEDCRMIVKDWPDADKANCLLTYGYIDVEGGMTLEIISCGLYDGETFSFFDDSKEERFFIRIGGAAECEVYFVDDPENKLVERYKDKLDVIRYYKAGEGKEKTRELRFIDSCRHEHYPDDIKVHLLKKGFGIEICWARLYEVHSNQLIAKLLNEPDQPFGYHEGDSITVSVYETDSKEIICCCDMNTSE